MFQLRTLGQRSVILRLAFAQALYLAGAAIAFTFSGLVGQSLAPDPALATLPMAIRPVTKDGANMPSRCQRVTSAAASSPCPIATTARGAAFGATAIAALAAGAAQVSLGWSVVNQLAVPLVLVAILTTLWLALGQRRAAVARADSPSRLR